MALLKHALGWRECWLASLVAPAQEQVYVNLCLALALLTAHDSLCSILCLVRQ